MDGGPRVSIDWTTVETVLLDMDGTVLDLGFDNFFWHSCVPERYARRHGMPAARARRLLQPIFDGAQGTLQWYCLDHWSRELAIDIAALKHEQRHRIRYLPKARRFLRTVRGLGKRLVLVTNAHLETLRIKSRYTGLTHHFDAVHSAHEFGFPKESIEFWGRLRDREPFAVESTVLIDDSLPVLRAAREFGLSYLYAIRKPDSSAPARHISEFPAVDSVSDLIEGVS